MQYQISGTVMQTLAIDLLPGEIVYSQTNCMCWMNDAIEMNTNTGDGFLAGFGRMFGGGSLFITDFTARGNGHVAFAPRFPGTIKPVQLADGESVICRKQTFLCAEKSVSLAITWQQRIGAGFFGGEGFILQQVTGPGTAFLDLSGEVVERDLAAGERLLVHAGHATRSVCCLSASTPRSVAAFASLAPRSVAVFASSTTPSVAFSASFWARVESRRDSAMFTSLADVCSWLTRPLTRGSALMPSDMPVRNVHERRVQLPRSARPPLQV
jgi:uncharacterized protein (AIM24 family)